MSGDGEMKVCRGCRRSLHYSRFAQTGGWNRKTGRRYGDHTCRDCRTKERRASNIPVRMPRYNAAGAVWCPAHDNGKGAYLPTVCFKPHPNRPGKFWWSCRDCTKAIDKRRRTVKLADQAAYDADLKRKRTRRRRRRQAERKQRRDELVAGIAALRAKGWTKAAICRATGLSFGNLLKWERGEVRFPRQSTVDRLYALIGRAAGGRQGQPSGSSDPAPRPAPATPARAGGLPASGPVRVAREESRR